MLKYIFLLSLTIIACQQALQNETKSYPDNVGDIIPNDNLDNPNFVTCHDDLILQYYNYGNAIQFDGEKRAIIDYFSKAYNKPKDKEDSGWITIKFVVNCHGETGRFRMEMIDSDYKSIKISKSISNQILDLTKSLKGWQNNNINDRIYDYNQYLTFKIVKGEIVHIMP